MANTFLRIRCQKRVPFAGVAAAASLGSESRERGRPASKARQGYNPQANPGRVPRKRFYPILDRLIPKANTLLFMMCFIYV